MIQLDRLRYRELLYAEAKLIELENWGVDNWEYYDDAIKDLPNIYEDLDRLSVREDN